MCCQTTCNIECLKKTIGYLSITTIVFALVQLVLQIVTISTNNYSIMAIVILVVTIISVIICILGSKVGKITRAKCLLLAGAILLFIQAVLFAVVGILILATASLYAFSGLPGVITIMSVYGLILILMICDGICVVVLRNRLMIKKMPTNPVIEQPAYASSPSASGLLVAIVPLPKLNKTVAILGQY